MSEPTFEIVPAEAAITPEAKQSLELAFGQYFADARALAQQTEAITDPKLARAARLSIKQLRVNAEKRRKELKEDSLRMGKAIDGANNILLALIVPIERRLEDIELAEERAERARLAAEQAVADAEEARRQEDARKAREAAEQEERTRQRMENIRLKKEADELKAAHEAERAETARLVEIDRQNLRKALDEQHAKDTAERQRLKAIADEERRKREALEAEAKAKADAEAKKKRSEAAAAKRAAAEPDRKKLLCFAKDVRDMVTLPTIANKQARDEIVLRILQLAQFIEEKAENL